MKLIFLHNPHNVFYNSDTCLTMSTLVNGWNTSILILQSAFTWFVQPSCLDPFYQDQLKLVKVTCFHLHNKNIKNTNFPELWLLVFKNDYDRQIDKVKLDMFQVYVSSVRAQGKYQTEGKLQVNSW